MMRAAAAGAQGELPGRARPFRPKCWDSKPIVLTIDEPGAVLNYGARE
jgi:hypothetical protein